MKKIALFINSVFIILVGFLSIVAFYASRWVIKTWGLLSMDEIIFHLKAPLDGTNTELIVDFFNYCVPVAVIYSFALIVVFIALREKKKLYFIITTASFLFSAACVFAGGKYVSDELGVAKYIEDQMNPSSFIEDYYADPNEVTVTFPEQKRNLIYIFMESMESTYASKEEGGAYKDNYIPELTELAKNNYNFSNTDDFGGAYMMPGSAWTMGALFAHTTGMPLKLPIGANSMDQQAEFLPDITSLGEILEGAGYYQTFMCGSNAIFGGRYNYFKQHGNYEIFDLFTARNLGKIPEDYLEFWGYEDEKLFTYAKEKLLELSANPEPFNLTLLTVDTHFEDGYICGLCENNYEDQYANVISCASRQVAEFVNWVQQQSFYENTTIVLVGDHLTMDSDFCETIDSDYDRLVYNTFINPAVEAENLKNRDFTTMDFFPTTLASLGATIEGERLGLGTNLFSEKETIAEIEGIEKMCRELERKSEFFEKFTSYITAEQ